jgi:EAL domain-containing protein (putative c-di-GMP-specific phosphodiesterase class I)/FixJ family two-component response regulator
MPLSAMTKAQILVVDDELANVVLMRRALRRAGFTHVRGLTDPIEALEMCETWNPDLILLDLHMPRVDGIAFLSTLRARSLPNDFLPVLMLTADIGSKVLKNSLAAGANDFATKPFDLDELLLRVRNLLSIRLCHEELKNINAALAADLRDYTHFDQRQAASRARTLAAIRDGIDSGGPRMVFQPIVELESESRIGVEALARFDTTPARTPDVWFAEAASVGLGIELELTAIASALEQLDRIPASQFMAVNVSPGTLVAPQFHQLLVDRPLDQIVLELTEHQPVDDYDTLVRSANQLRHRGARLAVDDAGAGFASLQHILQLRPDIIKLDIQLTRNVDTDPAKKALAAALVHFAHETGFLITAEGVETAGELAALRELGVPFGQGYLFARPGPLEKSIISGDSRAPLDAR